MTSRSWNNIRAQAAQFSKKWKDSNYEKGQMQPFYIDFFDVFGVPAQSVVSFEHPVKLLGNRQGYIDLLWEGKLIVEHKSAGGDLDKAIEQAHEYISGMNQFERPQYILVCDFQNFILIDLANDVEFSFKLADFSENVQKFGFIRDEEMPPYIEKEIVNITASRLVGNLYEKLKENGAKQDLEKFLVRLVFCFFADCTGIFEPERIFLDLIKKRTSSDGNDLSGRLYQLFQVLNQPIDQRQKALDEDLDKFSHVNGDLFKENIQIPQFDAEMRALLLDACHFDWEGISPAIFGSLFQFVMDQDERREQGVHYTTEQNIMKVIEPLFLTQLKLGIQPA